MCIPFRKSIAPLERRVFCLSTLRTANTGDYNGINSSGSCCVCPCCPCSCCISVASFWMCGWILIRSYPMLRVLGALWAIICSLREQRRRNALYYSHNGTWRFRGGWHRGLDVEGSLDKVSVNTKILQYIRFVRRSICTYR